MASHNTSPKKLNELSKPLREEAQFFLEPATPRQRQYEALRAYFVEQLPVKEVATRFGYTPGAFYGLCHQFRHTPNRAFFLSTKPGPKYIAFLIQLWIVPIPAEFGGLEVEPLEELPEAVADLGERFVERKMFAEVILPLEPQVFCRVLFRGVGSKQQTRHGPLCLRYPRIFASRNSCISAPR